MTPTPTDELTESIRGAGLKVTEPRIAAMKALHQKPHGVLPDPVSMEAAHPRGGKTPCRAMQKENVRYGGRLLWGWSPPA